ncbi:hypothetical protein ACIQU1_14110 [Streptomyces angustmyceticus]|uniref:hypothetical protein n=1 Tax=Streptomyces angustmyceticus TaxID=285578 RepID=UPI0037F1FFD5
MSTGTEPRDEGGAQGAGRRGPEDAGSPLITQHAAVVFLVAVIIGLSVGGLTAASGKPWPLAAIAGLTAAGVSMQPAHRLIG